MTPAVATKHTSTYKEMCDAMQTLSGTAATAIAVWVWQFQSHDLHMLSLDPHSLVPNPAAGNPVFSIILSGLPQMQDSTLLEIEEWSKREGFPVHPEHTYIDPAWR